MTSGLGLIKAAVAGLLMIGAGAALWTDGQTARTSAAVTATIGARPEPRTIATAKPAPKTLALAAYVTPTVKPVPAPDTFVVKRVLSIDGPFKHGDYVWEPHDAPAGPIVITVDLAAQTLSVFRGGYEIGAAVILYGADNKPTPLGAFAITQKDADHVSNLYDAPMPYMLRLTADGVAIHGSNVEQDAATNGCIGVPTEFAALLFREAKLGDRVIITNGKMMQLGDASAG